MISNAFTGWLIALLWGLVQISGHGINLSHLKATDTRQLEGRIARHSVPPIWLSHRGGASTDSGITGILSRTIGGVLRRILSAFGATRQLTWTEAFEQEYGKRHPAFVEASSLQQASRVACSHCKFLIVYLPSTSSRDEKKHKVFCRTLTDPKELKARKQPYLAVIHMPQKPPRKISVISVHHFRPPPDPSQAVLWLNRTLEIHGYVLKDDEKEKTYQSKEAKLQVEQDVEFSKALKADRGRDEQEAREARERKEREAAAAKKAIQDQERREEKAAKMSTEPPDGTLGICRVAVKLKDGSKIQRAFVMQDCFERIFDWLDVQGLDLEDIALIQLRPKRSFLYPQDAQLTLAEAGLAGQVLLLLQGRSQVTGPAEL